PRSEAYFVFPLAQGTPGKQCGLAATGVYQPSLRSPWLAAEENMMASQHHPSYPHAPVDWSAEAAEKLAREEHLELAEDHWEELAALQEYYARHERVNLRELSDALEERFHARGGKKYLFSLFPGGPIAQGCRLAGLDMPRGAVDQGFGSIV
ncbi:TusE/DsrC/DsvC family sulfur relay protein, partial [Thiolapillus sp.]